MGGGGADRQAQHLPQRALQPLQLRLGSSRTDWSICPPAARPARWLRCAAHLVRLGHLLELGLRLCLVGRVLVLQQARPGTILLSESSWGVLEPAAVEAGR